MHTEAPSIVGEADGSTRPDPAQLRARLRAMWAAVASAWEEHADYVDTRGPELTERMLELAAPNPGERVLELAAGAGGLGLAAAERVGPEGEVVVSDLVGEMVEIAAARAAQRGLANVTTRVLDVEEPDESYDVVLCREGLMFAPDPARAAGELRRVLRPGGRVALAVWGPRERNPWLGIVFDAVAEQVGAPMPPPGVPGPSRSATPRGWRGCSARRASSKRSATGSESWSARTRRPPASSSPASRCSPEVVSRGGGRP